MTASDNILLTFIAAPGSLALGFGIIIYYLKLKRKTVEFNILLLVVINLILETIISMLITAVFAEYIIWIAILGATLFLFNVYLMYQIVTTLLKQKATINKYTQNLESVIKTSSETSINVSNSATQLAASASEVNSTSEEISATTMEVNLKAHSQTKSLADINEMAQEIKMISDVITNISGQTNLLALNASIEAGRAGQQGLGFAVVAEKVQKLAEEAKSSVEKTSEIVAKISTSIKQAAADSIEIASAMEQISSSAEEQTASMEEISATADNLGVQAEELKTQLSAFENMRIVK